MVAKLDRLSRDLWFITTIQKVGVKFICADNPEINNLTLHILGAMAQHERHLISERTRAALASAKSRGMKLGNPRLLAVRNADTSAARRKIKSNADQFAREVRPLLEGAIHNGKQSLSSLARFLNDQGIPTQRGNKWTPMGVKRVLARETKADLLDDILRCGLHLTMASYHVSRTEMMKTGLSCDLPAEKHWSISSPNVKSSLTMFPTIVTEPSCNERN